MPLSYAVVIPARYHSSRFPGKPLVNLCGKPMIQHVWERCCLAVPQQNVYVATDDARIVEACKGFSAKVILTSSDCKTGTDRIAEANRELDVDFMINVQGDEPLVEPEDIKSVIETYLNNPETVINTMSKISSKEEFYSLTVPKVVFDKSGNLLYMSRSAIPGNKNGKFNFAYKQVCIYAFSRDHLEFFIDTEDKTPLEATEDIEILRFLESGYRVKMLEVKQGSIAVDVIEDVPRVVDRMEKLAK